MLGSVMSVHVGVSSWDLPRYSRATGSRRRETIGTDGNKNHGAEEGTRTPTPLRVHGPEPCASANSATSASGLHCAAARWAACQEEQLSILQTLPPLSNGPHHNRALKSNIPTTYGGWAGWIGWADQRTRLRARTIVPTAARPNAGLGRRPWPTHRSSRPKSSGDFAAS